MIWYSLSSLVITCYNNSSFKWSLDILFLEKPDFFFGCWASLQMKNLIPHCSAGELYDYFRINQDGRFIGEKSKQLFFTIFVHICCIQIAINYGISGFSGHSCFEPQDCCEKIPLNPTICLQTGWSAPNEWAQNGHITPLLGFFFQAVLVGEEMLADQRCARLQDFWDPRRHSRLAPDGMGRHLRRSRAKASGWGDRARCQAGYFGTSGQAKPGCHK